MKVVLSWFGSLGLSCRYKRFLSYLDCSSRPSIKYYLPHRKLFQFLCPHRPQAGQAAGLGRLSLGVCVSGWERQPLELLDWENVFTVCLQYSAIFHHSPIPIVEPEHFSSLCLLDGYVFNHPLFYVLIIFTGSPLVAKLKIYLLYRTCKILELSPASQYKSPFSKIMRVFFEYL